MSYVNEDKSKGWIFRWKKQLNWWLSKMFQAQVERQIVLNDKLQQFISNFVYLNCWC